VTSAGPKGLAPFSSFRSIVADASARYGFCECEELHVHLSTHYYVLCLGEQRSSLYECFSDTLIDVHNKAFPVVASVDGGALTDDSDEARMLDLMRTVDQRFDLYYEADPLRLIVVGDRRLRSAFRSVTSHGGIVVGEADGDHTATSLSNLGQIVWPIVKDAMSGLRDAARLDLEAAERTNRLAAGLQEVGSYLDVGGRLLVDEDYHVTGSLLRLERTLVVSHERDVREPIDDVIDTIVESILETGGSVVFMKADSLKKQHGIALILPRPKDL
jgi:hypothetical protein